MGSERAKSKASDNARVELGEERAKAVEEWATKAEELAKGAEMQFSHGSFFWLFDWLRLRGVTKEQAARTSELLVNHHAGRETP